MCLARSQSYALIRRIHHRQTVSQAAPTRICYKARTFKMQQPYTQDQLRNTLQHRFSIMLFDRPDALEDRHKHFNEHKQGLFEYKQQHPGVIEFGGPMLHPESHLPIGSVFVLKRGDVIPTLQAANEWVERDVYHRQNVWERREVSLFAAMTTPYQNVPSSSSASSS